MVGTVVETNGSRFRPRDRVLAVPISQHGLFERFVLDENRAIPIDPRPTNEHALLAQPLGTVIYAMKKLPAVIDQDVAIVGQGPMGQIFCSVLRNLGARRIIAIDLLAGRLRNSERMGATHTICAATEDVSQRVQEITAGEMGDLVIEAVGHRNQALDLCTQLCRRKGQILFFGVPQETIQQIHWLDLFRKNITLHTSVEPDFSRDFPLAMQWIAEGRIDLRPLITHRYALHEIQRAFEAFCNKEDDALKVLIDFPQSGQ